MSGDQQVSSDGIVDLSDERARAIDGIGRLAGAALRSPAPAHGAAAIQHRAWRRRAGRAAAAVTGVAVLTVAGLVVFGPGDRSGDQQPVDTVTDTSSPAPRARLGIVEAGTLSEAYGVRFSADGSLLAVSGGGDVRLHDPATLALVRELPCPVSIEHLPVSAGTDQSRDEVWDLAAAAGWDDESLSVLRTPGDFSCGAVVNADGTRASSSADVQGGAGELLWDTSDGSLVAVAPDAWRSAFSADGSRWVTWEPGPSFSLWDSSTGAPVTSVIDHASHIAFSPDGSRVLRWGRPERADGTDAEATVYDMQTLRPLATLPSVPPDVDAVFDDTGDRIATWDGAGVTIWDATTGTQLRRISTDIAESSAFGAVAFSPGGTMLAVEHESSVAIFESSSGVRLADLDLGPGTQATGVVFSADGSSLAVGFSAIATEQSYVRIWTYTRA